MKKWLRDMEAKVREKAERLLRFFIRAEKTAPSGIDAKNIKTILVVRQHNELGDMLITSPIFRALKENFPGCRLLCVARKTNLEIARANPFIDEVLEYNSRKALIMPWTFFAMLWHLRKQKPDVAIVPCTVSFSISSAFIAFLSGARIKIGGGTEDIFYKNGEMFFNIYLNVKTRGLHQVDVNLEYLKPLGISEVSDRSLIAAIKKEDEEEAAAGLKEKGVLPGEFLLGIHPGAGKFENRWGASNFASLVSLLTEKYKLKLLVFYGKAESELKDELLKGLKQEAILLDPLPLMKAAAYMKQCDLFLCNDTGVLHVAAAVGTRTFAVFGKASPAFWNPPGPGHYSVWNSAGEIKKISVQEAFNVLEKSGVIPGEYKKNLG